MMMKEKVGSKKSKEPLNRQDLKIINQMKVAAPKQLTEAEKADIQVNRIILERLIRVFEGNDKKAA